MIHKNNIVVFDTETSGDLSSPFIYDIAWEVLDKNLQVVKTREFLVKEIFDNRFIMSKAYYAEKKPLYDEWLKTNEIKLLEWHKILELLVKDVRHYGAKVLSAYNVAFDHRALLATTGLTASHMLPKLEKLLGRTELLCIWNLAVDTLMAKEEYTDFAIANKFISEKGNIITNAEVAYRALTNDVEFTEQHTALADVEIEVEILRHCLTEYSGRVSYGKKYGVWRKVQPKG